VSVGGHRGSVAGSAVTTLLPSRLRRQQGAKPKRRPELRTPPYDGRYRGATAVVLGNGPSLSTHRDALRRLIEAKSAVTLGANHVTPFMHPHYHAFTNRKRFVRYANTIDPERSRVLLSPYFPRKLVRQHYRGPYEEIAYVADNEAPFEIRDGVIQTSGRTVSVLLIGVAAVMGAERILVAGLDGFRSVLSGKGTDPESLYHVRTDVLKHEGEQYAEVDRETRRLLGEIDEHLVREGREPLAIVTPTAYEGHYRPKLLDPHR
jgi:hypothetical protein